MTKREIASLIIGTFFLLIIAFAVVSTVLGIVPFLFNIKMLDLAGAFLIISVVCFLYLIFSLLSDNENIPKFLSIAIRIICVAVSLLLIAASLFFTFFLREPLVKHSVSNDKKYEAYIQTNGWDSSWTVTVYKRHFLGLNTVETQTEIFDMCDTYGTDGYSNVEISWESESCNISYQAYDTENEEPQPKTEKIYFD